MPLFCKAMNRNEKGRFGKLIHDHIVVDISFFTHTVASAFVHIDEDAFTNGP